MDISKYLKNKDIQLSNDDLDIEKLEKDIRKGYVSSAEVEKAKEDAVQEFSTKYTALEEEKTKLEKSYTDIEARNTELTSNNKALGQKVEMVSLGFKKEDLDEVSKLRNSVYADEQDDIKAFTSIKERYGATFGFNKQEEKKPEVPNEPQFNANNKPQQEVKVTRKTSIKDLIIK